MRPKARSAGRAGHLIFQKALGPSRRQFGVVHGMLDVAVDQEAYSAGCGVPCLLARTRRYGAACAGAP